MSASHETRISALSEEIGHVAGLVQAKIAAVSAARAALDAAEDDLASTESLYKKLLDELYNLATGAAK